MSSSDSTAIEWGVLLTLPNGATDTKRALTSRSALAAAARIERCMPALLVYRTITYGADWTTDFPTGDVQWGCRESWDDSHHEESGGDGYVEVREHDNRHEAEVDVRAGEFGTSTRVVVARTRTVGDWLPTEVSS